MRFLDKIKVKEILPAVVPAVVGAAGVVYDAFQAHGSVSNSEEQARRIAQELFERGASWAASRSGVNRGEAWTKRMQTGQLLAIAALATGALVAKFKGGSASPRSAKKVSKK